MIEADPEAISLGLAPCTEVNPPPARGVRSKNMLALLQIGVSAPRYSPGEPGKAGAADPGSGQGV